MVKFTLAGRLQSCLLILAVILLSNYSYSQQLSARQQKMQSVLAADGTVKEFTTNPELHTPAFISFGEASPHSESQARSLIQHYFMLDAAEGNELRMSNRTVLKSGAVVERYTQFFKGIKLEHAAYVTTSSNGKLRTISAENYELPKDFTLSPALSEAAAKTAAIRSVNARKYVWDALDDDIANTNNPALREKLIALKNEYTPRGELVIAKDLYHGGQARLAWKFDIYAAEPLSRNYIYIDAQNGAVILINPIIKHAGGKHPVPKKPAPAKWVNAPAMKTIYPW
ncbi:MAG TPA: hypothetical protein VEB42_15540, partial [Chitinophagaceae bacterium]|nr:hypothetical protein [Chitinophagaceae bacterium]